MLGQLVMGNITGNWFPLGIRVPQKQKTTFWGCNKKYYEGDGGNFVVLQLFYGNYVGVK